MGNPGGGGGIFFGEGGFGAAIILPVKKNKAIKTKNLYIIVFINY